MKGFRIDEGQLTGGKAYLPFGHPENHFAGIDGTDAESPMHVRFEQPSAVLGIAAFGKGQALVSEEVFPIHGRFMPWRAGRFRDHPHFRKRHLPVVTMFWSGIAARRLPGPERTP